MLKMSLSLEGKGYLHFSDPSLLHRPAQSLRLRPRATDEACGSLPTVGAMGGHRGTRASG